MPITVERIEPRIYLSIYKGKATSEEISDVIERRKTLADEHHDSSYVSIADLTGITSFPLDVASLRGVAESDPRNLRYLLVGASLQIRVLVEGFGANANTQIEFFKTLDEAIARAHVLLEESDQA